MRASGCGFEGLREHWDGGGTTTTKTMRDAFGKRLKVCVWVPTRTSLQRGIVCVGEKCVFVFA